MFGNLSARSVRKIASPASAKEERKFLMEILANFITNPDDIPRQIVTGKKKGHYHFTPEDKAQSKQ